MVKQTSCTTHGHQQWQSVLSASAFFPCCPVQLWRYTLTYVRDCCAIFEANSDFVLACEILTLLRTALETKRTVSQVNDWGLLMKVIGFGWGIVFVVFVVSFFCFGGKKQFEVHEAACSLNWIVTMKSSYAVGCTGKTTWQWSLCSQLSKWKIAQGNSVVVSWWQSVNNANGSITFGVETYSTYTVLYNTARQTRSLVVTCTLLVANGGRIWPAWSISWLCAWCVNIASFERPEFCLCSSLFDGLKLCFILFVYYLPASANM
jgi:hypothetical protein